VAPFDSIFLCKTQISSTHQATVTNQSVEAQPKLAGSFAFPDCS